MTDTLPIKKRARNIAFDTLSELATRNDEPYSMYDARPVIKERLKHILSEDDDTLDALLDPIVDGAIRDADRSMCEAKADRLRRVQIGELPLFMDYDPDATLALGDTERIRLGSARLDHVKRSLRLDTDNVIAVNQAYAEKHSIKQGLIDVMEPLDPRTIVDQVVREPEAEAA